MCSKDLAESLVEKVSSRVVVLDLTSALRVNVEAEALSAVGRDALCNVDCEVVLLDCVHDLDLLAALRKDVSCISYLTTHLCVERSALKYELEQCLVLSLHCTMTCELNSLEVCAVVTNELDAVAVCELYPVTRLYGCSVTSSVFLLLELCLEFLEVDLVALL